MILKKIPSDFEVEEVPLRNLKNKGRYIIYELKKTSMNTEDAAQEVAKAHGVQRKNVSYAGTKDKNAVTTQRISVLSNKIKIIKKEKIETKFLGYDDEPLSLGMLKGNKFKITIRNLKGNETIKKDTKIINYFHKQRFSNKNVEIGKLLLKKRYKEAIETLKTDVKVGKKINEHLKKNKNDYVGALRTIPKKILTLYAHAYQSELWNKTAKQLIKDDALPQELPIIGFGETNTTLEALNVIKKIMNEEKINTKDFLNKDIPCLCLEGTQRKTISHLKNLVIKNFEEDELNKERKKITISFELGKGEYATNAVEQIISN